MADTRTRWLTPEETAEELSFSRSTILVHCRTGKLPGARKFGGEWRIPRTALDPVDSPPPLIAPRNRRSTAQQKRTA